MKDICYTDNCPWAQHDGYTYHCTMPVCMDVRRNTRAQKAYEENLRIQRQARRKEKTIKRLRKILADLEGQDDKCAEKSSTTAISGHRTQD